MAYALAACGLALVIICVPVVSKLADKPEAVQKIDDKASKSVTTAYYGESPLGEGDLSKGVRRTGKAPALAVEMTEPQSIYLRGFVGDVLDGCQWETLPYSSYYENRNRIYWINHAGLNGLGQVGQAARLAGFDRGVKSAVAVEVEGASRKYAYIPYEIDKHGVAQGKNWNDSFVTSVRGARLKEYTYTMGANAVSKWTNVAGKLFTAKNNLKIDNYLTAESHYNKYVYENYLFISDEDAAALEQFAGDKGDQSRGHIEYNTAISKVKNLLTFNVIYDTKPGKLKGKKSAVRSIFRRGTGYDTHYATLATMLFRYYGIPARYVEGYLITPEEVQNSPAGVFNVKQSAAHAWTEIYVDGIGFVPVETCPEYAGVMEEADYTIGISNKSVKNNFDENKNKGKAPEDTYKEINKGLGKKTSRILMIVGGLIALGILIVIGILVGRVVRKRLQLRRRKKLFKTGEPREAVRDMYRYMEEIGLHPDDITVDTGNRASYSMHQVTDSDRQVMLAALEVARRQIRADKTKKKQAEKRGRIIAKAEGKAEAKAEIKKAGKIGNKLGSRIKTGKKTGKKENS